MGRPDWFSGVVTSKRDTFLCVIVYCFINLGRHEDKQKKLGRIIKKTTTNYRIKSLFKYLNVDENKHHVLLDIINIFSLEDKMILQKRFGSLYDGEDVKEITQHEKNRIFLTLIPKIKEMFEVLSSVSQKDYEETLKLLASKHTTRRRNTSILIRKMTIEEFEKEQKEKEMPKISLKKVINVEEVELREEKKESYYENIAYIRNLVEILEEEKKDVFKNYRKKLQYFKDDVILLARKLKIYSLDLSSYGFTKEEAIFILINTTEGLNLSKNQILSLLGVEQDNLSEIYLSSIDKIKVILCDELDNYISLLKEKRNINE